MDRHATYDIGGRRVTGVGTLIDDISKGVVENPGLRDVAGKRRVSRCHVVFKKV
ncbi:MAG: hypothetical protein VCB77_05410 [Alphaproteobacteria bacterium]